MAHNAKFSIIAKQRNAIREITPDDGLWVCAYNDDEDSEEFGDETEIRISGLTPRLLITALWAEVGAGTITHRDMMAGDARSAAGLLGHLMTWYLKATVLHTPADMLIEAYMVVHGIRDREAAAERLGEELTEMRANMN